LTLTREGSAFSTTWLRGGPALLLPARTSIAAAVTTDQRNPSFASLDARISREADPRSWSVAVNPLLNARSSRYVQWSIGPQYQTDVVAWQHIGVADGAAGPSWVLARLRQRTFAVTARADMTFSPRVVVQLYAQPFTTLGQYDGWTVVNDPRAPDAAGRVRSLGSDHAYTDGTGLLHLDVNADGITDSIREAPDGQERTLNASAVLRWEYRPGSFFTLVWNQLRAARSNDGAESASGSLLRLFDDRARNVLVLKANFRIGR
jgi:hypothetical protein